MNPVFWIVLLFLVASAAICIANAAGRPAPLWLAVILLVLVEAIDHAGIGHGG